MSDKKQLNEEELEKVNGGGWAEEKSAYLPADHGRHIGKYEAENHIGEKFYIVEDAEPRKYYWGTLLKSWEKSGVLWLTHRYHKFHVEGTRLTYSQTYLTGQDAEFCGDHWTLFLMK